MKAIQINQERSITIVSLPEPEPASGEVRLQLKYVGFCGSDLNTFLGRNPMVKLPVIPGHEVGAIIDKVGPDVPPTLTAGMVVTVNPYTNCGQCAACQNQRPNACQHNQTLGVQRQGAMRQQIVLPWQKVLPAAGLTPRQCALVEPMSVGFHAIARGEVTDTDTVLVIGCGMVGIGAIVRAAARGATVIAADIDDQKLALARQMGARHGINTQTEDLLSQLQQLTGGSLPSVVIEAVGSPQTYLMAVDAVAFTGRIVCIGYAKSSVPFETKYFVQKELDIRGSRNALPADFKAVIRYLEQGSCPTDRLISRVLTPEEAPEAMAQWAAQPGKVFRLLVKF